MSNPAVESEPTESSEPAGSAETADPAVESAAPRRLRLPSEVVYLAAVLLIAVAVSMTVTAGFGISMVVAPAYLLSEKVDFLTFGQSEYLLQGGLFVLFCIIVRRFKPVYLSAFVTSLFYGFVLDLVQRFIPLLNPAVTPSESLPIPVRLLLFVCGVTLTAFSVALFFKVYLYPQVNDFFVKGIVERYHLREGPSKTAFDLSCLAVSLILSFALFGRLVGVGIGTVVITLMNGTIIGAFSKLLDRTVSITPVFPKFAKLFEI